MSVLAHCTNLWRKGAHSFSPQNRNCLVVWNQQVVAGSFRSTSFPQDDDLSLFWAPSPTRYRCWGSPCPPSAPPTLFIKPTLHDIPHKLCKTRANKSKIRSYCWRTDLRAVLVFTRSIFKHFLPCLTFPRQTELIVSEAKSRNLRGWLFFLRKSWTVE